MKKRGKKIVVIMPAYNAEKTLVKTYNDIPPGIVDEIILVDDGSHDKTVKIAKSLGIKTFMHPQNRGYGGNQKTCYTIALNENADIVVMIHPDYQYDSSLTEEIIKPIRDGRFDLMLGSRIRSRRETLNGGMPFYKYISNRFLTILENIVMGQNLSEYHTGFRAYDKKILRKVPFHKFSDDFIFDQQMLISSLYSGFRIGEIYVPVRYFPDASSISLLRSIVYGMGILWVLIEYILATLKIHRSNIFSHYR